MISAKLKPTLCGWRDSNPHTLRRQILSLVRLPISPHPQYEAICLGGAKLHKLLYKTNVFHNYLLN